MTITINLPSGHALNFQDGTSPDVIKQAVAKFTGTQTANLDQSAAPPSGVERFAAPQVGESTVTKDWGALDYAKDIGKSAVSGAAEGLIGLGALPAEAFNLAARGFGYDRPQFGQATQDISSAVQSVTGEFPKSQSTAGEVARTVGQFAPGVLFPAAGAGGMGARVVGNVLAPAGGSEIAGRIAKAGGGNESLARIGGALAGGFAPSALARLHSPTRLPAAQTASDAERARQVAVLEGEGFQRGTTLTAGDVTGSPLRKTMESVAESLPLGPGTRSANAKAEQFTRSLLRRIGENEPVATPAVMTRAHGRISNVFRNVGQNMTRVLPNRRTDLFARTLDDIATRYEGSIGSAAPDVRRYADEILDTYRNRQFNGEAYNRARSRLSTLSQEAGDPGARIAARNMINALDGLVQASRVLPRAQQQALATARRQWGQLKDIEDALSKAGGTGGLVSPQQFRATVARQNKRGYVQERGPSAALARAGSELLKTPPNSGTPQRLLAQGLFHAPAAATLGAAGYGAAFDDPRAYAAAAMFATPGLLARGYMSPAVQRYLMPRNAPAPNVLPQASIQGTARNAALGTASAAANTPLRGSVGPGDRQLTEEEKQLLMQQLSR